MARNKGQFEFSANFQVKNAAPLDPRVAVDTKAELIDKETWPYDGNTVYLYNGLLVAVNEEKSVYQLTNKDKALASDYSGWTRIDVNAGKHIQNIEGKQPLTIQLNGGSTEGTNKFTYNVESAKTVNITPANIGAATSSHTHSVNDITGVLPISKGGTGASSTLAANYNLFKTYSKRDGSTVTDDTEVAFFTNSPDTTKGALHGINLGSIWTWISGKGVLTTGNYTSTLDSRYVNASGDTMTGKLTLPSGSDAFNDASILFGNVGRIGGVTGGLGLYSTGESIFLRPNQTTTLDQTKGLVISGSTLKYNQQEVVTEGNTITLTGDVTGSASFDGSANISIPVTIANDSHTHATSASSNATTNLTITAGGTTATVADLYATYADQLRTARTISLTGDVTGSVSFNGTGNVNLTTTIANNSHNRDAHSDKNYYFYSQNTTIDCENTPSNIPIYSGSYNTSHSGWSGAVHVFWTGGGSNSGLAFMVPGGAVNKIKVYQGIDSKASSWTLSGTLAYLSDITWANLPDKPSLFTPSSHTHTISQISDLNASWDSLLANAPSAYLTRWPSISEVTGKQNLVIRLNGGTTEGTNQFTYNGTAGKTLSITPSNIGAANSSHNHTYIRPKGRITAISGNTKPGEGLSFVECYNNGYPTTYGNVLQIQGAWSSGAGQLLLGWTGDSSLGRIYYRSLRDTTNSWSSWGTLAYLTDITWNNISGKPSWIGSSKPSYSWSEISGKPSTFTPSAHSHALLNGWGDTRSVAETPNSYNGQFKVAGIKYSSTYGISSGTYVQVLGFRGWTDSSGGRAHELAFADNGRIYHRDGSTTSWDSWDTVAYLSDIPSLSGYATQSWCNTQFTTTSEVNTLINSALSGFSTTDTKNTTGTSNSTSKLYLVGGTSQSSSGVVTYSNSAVYTQSGQLYATRMNSINGFYETSDARLKDFKDNIKALDTVDKIPTKYFTWKEDENQESQIGTSAQEVEKLYPELVSKTEDDTLTVDYAKLSIIALAAIKELKAEIQSLKDEIKQLKLK